MVFPKCLLHISLILSFYLYAYFLPFALNLSLMVYPLINSPISYTSHLNEDLVSSVIMLPSTLANYSKNQLIKSLSIW